MYPNQKTVEKNQETKRMKNISVPSIANIFILYQAKVETILIPLYWYQNSRKRKAIEQVPT